MKDLQIIDGFIKDSKKKKAEKAKRNKSGKNRKFGHKKFENAHILIKPKFAKKNKANFDDMVFDGLESFGHELFKFYTNKKVKFDKEDLVDGFSDKRIVKPFIAAMKQYQEEDIELPIVYLYMISDFYLSAKAVTDEEKSFKKLLKIFEKANEKKIKKIKKILKDAGCDKKVAHCAALKLALVSQSFEKNRSNRQRIYKFLNELYRAFNDGEKIKEKSIAKLIEACYGGKGMFHFAMTALQDKNTTYNQLKTPQEKEVYSTVTNIVLNFVNKLDNDDRKDFLKTYAKKRENQVNIKKRVNFYSGIDDNDYKGIMKTISRLMANGYRKELFE